MLAHPLIAMTFVLTAVGTVAGVSSCQHQKFVDEREGKLAGQLLASVGENAPLNDNAPTYFFFSMPKGSEDARYLVPIHLRLTNTSNTHDEQIRLVIEYDRKYLRSVISEEFITHNTSRLQSDRHFEQGTGSNYDYAKYSMAFLSPHDSASFTDGAFATFIPYDLKAPLLFNSSVGLDAKVSTYSQRDIRRDWSIRYRGLRVPNNAGIELVMREWYAKQLAFEIRRESGFWAYIPKLLFGKEVVMYWVSPDFRFIPQLNTFFPSELPDFVGFHVKPYHWKLLFGFF